MIIALIVLAVWGLLMPCATIWLHCEVNFWEQQFNSSCRHREKLSMENQALRKANATLTETNKDIDSEYRKALGTIQQVREFLDPKPIVFTNCTFHGKSNEELST